jgi:hypothetical protein
MSWATNDEQLTLWRRPTVHLSVKVDTDDLGGFQLPWDVGHDVDSVGTSDTTSDHTEATGVWRMRVSSNHHQTWDGVVFKDDLVAEDEALGMIQARSSGEFHSHDTGSWLPEADSVFGTGSGKEVVDLLVDVNSSSQILHTADLGLDQVITVDGSGDSGLGKTGRHELQDGHLCRS